MLSFIDISSLYNDKQTYAYEMAEQISNLPPHPYILDIKEPYYDMRDLNTIMFKSECPEHLVLWK